MLISFCSNKSGYGTTTNLISLSLALSLSKKHKVLIINCSYDDYSLEKALISDVSVYNESVISGYGILPLIRLKKNGLLTLENYSNYTVPLLKNGRYDMLIGLNKPSLEQEELKEFESKILEVICMSKEIYDYVFVDISNKFNDKLFEDIREKSDLIVVNINQNLSDMQRVLDSNESLHFSKTLYAIGRYEDRVKSCKKNIERKFKLKNILTVPYEPALIDFINKGAVLEYFGKNITDSRKVKNEFFKKLLKSVDIIESYKVKR